MHRILHILTEKTDPLAMEVFRLQRNLRAQEFKVVDLTKPAPDYQQLLEEIFLADSVQVW